MERRWGRRRVKVTEPNLSDLESRGNLFPLSLPFFFISRSSFFGGGLFLSGGTSRRRRRTFLSSKCSKSFPVSPLVSPSALTYSDKLITPIPPQHNKCTRRMGWMAHRKWKEAKQLPGTAGPGNMLGCSLISFHFLLAIHPQCSIISHVWKS